MRAEVLTEELEAIGVCTVIVDVEDGDPPLLLWEAKLNYSDVVSAFEGYLHP